jgi:hypothetical protein
MKLKFNMALMLLMVAAVAISSCGNDDDENGQTSIQTNTWLIDGRLFIMNDPLPPEFTDGRFNASGIHTDGNSLLSIFFPDKPTSSGTYNIVSATTNVAQLGPNECFVSVNNTFTPATLGHMLQNIKKF